MVLAALILTSLGVAYLVVWYSLGRLFPKDSA